MGRRQTVQTQNAASDQGLHCLLTGISITHKIKNENSTPDTLNIGNGLFQLIRMEMSTRHSWVKNAIRGPVDSELYSNLKKNREKKKKSIFSNIYLL